MKKLYFSLLTFLFLVVAQAQIVNIPDANFKAALLSASPSNQIAAINMPSTIGLVGSMIINGYNKIDVNNDGEIQVSEAQTILSLQINYKNISNINGIEAFINLVNLECNNNLITSINLNQNTNLKYLDCSNNLLTNLDVTQNTNLLRNFCMNNQLSSLNLSQNILLNMLICSSNQLTSLDVTQNLNLLHLDCASNQFVNLNLNNNTLLNVLGFDNNQITSIDLSNLINLEYLGCGSNQLTELDLSSNILLGGLNCENNYLTNLNTLNNTNLSFIYCGKNLFTHLDFSHLHLLVSLSFAENINLISANLKNNNQNWDNFWVSFDNNPNLNYLCVDDEDLTLFQYILNYNTNTNNCHVNSYCSFTPGGTFYTIQGNENFDINNNGCDSNDIIYPNLKFNITNGTISGSLISNASGNYSIPVAAGTHTITPVLENPSYFTVSPANAVVSFPTEATPFTQNFCIAPNGVHHDLELVVIPIVPARPGFDATYKIKYKNKGNLNETAVVNFNYNEAILDFVSSSYALTAQSAGTISWDLGTIAPFQTGEILVTLNLNSPMETPAVNADDILNYSANIVGLSTDETPDDNAFGLNQIVVNSFDPNDKTCLEGATINPSMIGKYVHYKIRFENTGTFPAQNIVVKDLIDTTKFDLSTLQMTDASHNCVTRINNTNKVEFIFENINLPFDDANNDGYVVFKIKTKPTLTVNSTISNVANIYFDYNFPIVTNAATSTFQVLKTDTFVFDNYFTIYPNPVKNELNLSTKQATTIYSLSIYNTLGQQVQTTTNPEKTIDVTGLKTGNYIMKVTTDKGVSSSKFVKE